MLFLIFACIVDMKPHRKQGCPQECPQVQFVPQMCLYHYFAYQLCIDKNNRQCISLQVLGVASKHCSQGWKPKTVHSQNC